MSDRSTKLLLSDLLESISKINLYTSSLDFNSFCENEMVIDAVIRNFEIIGEAAAKLPKAFTATYKYINWRSMKNFRNLLIHEYFGIDLRFVWGIIQNKLPELEKELNKIYSTLPDSLL
ncbi:MAG TPA: DUF86 domain-containing protein [Chitinophagaceae bacterium]|jgi:uncharacterized protein with HEPN domain